MRAQEASPYDYVEALLDDMKSRLGQARIASKDLRRRASAEFAPTVVGSEAVGS
jgi:hypothetical protein